VFQLDMQERLHWETLGYFNVLHLRAPQWGITVGCVPHPAGQTRWMHKVSQAQARDDCRTAFEQWGLPEVVQTDKDKVLTTSDETPFPTDFTLWLVGLGIHHRIIQRVTQNASVERCHRTFDKQLLSGPPPTSWAEFEATIHHEQQRLTERLPSRAKACRGQIPILAHPEARTPKRPYARDHEPELFDLDRVVQYLAGGHWLRHASRKGQFHFADRLYSVGTAHGTQWLTLTFDPATRQFAVHAQTGEFIKYLPAEWLTAARLRGLEDNEIVKEPAAT
jgi:hypothetical protein